VQRLNLRSRLTGDAHPRRRLFVGPEAISTRQFDRWAGLASAAVHAAVAGLILLSTGAPQPASRQEPRQHPARAVTLLYVPPQEAPPPSRTPVQPRPSQPQAEPVSPAPEPLPLSPHAAGDVPDHDDPVAASPDPGSSSKPGDFERASSESLDGETAAEQEDVMVSEARRLFGPRSEGGLAVQLLGGGRCRWGEPDASDETLPAIGVVEGVVRNETSGRPLPGAFLQLMGTGSAVFSDARGHYRLTFDPSLVGRCRSQVVRVTAPGYRARNMILSVGPSSNNTVDMKVR
jgi:hypothetical protein